MDLLWLYECLNVQELSVLGVQVRTSLKEFAQSFYQHAFCLSLLSDSLSFTCLRDALQKHHGSTAKADHHDVPSSH